MWQKIETAPKDGTEFLVCYGRQQNVMELIYYNRIHRFWASKGKPVLGFVESATHWMPLPPPPTDTAPAAQREE